MGNLRVLAIDDSFVIRQIIEHIVAHTDGFDLVGSAPDLETGRPLIQRCAPDVVTVDLAMPGESGLEFLDAIKALDHPAVVVVSASTYRGSDAVVEAIAHGADACFDKGRLLPDSRLFMRTLGTVVARRAHRLEIGSAKGRFA
ncbi:response regulator [Sphingomonas abietis]|uniref:Response regulator n=1 Tax=Sphingomonas abietis TaxID=3012344 RepID=A0ABY7NKL8_9SPHN|nr:response regulator [Sphingomonas abietis]WBO21142.1 response regulator [Sphingomonas abietis]